PTARDGRQLPAWRRLLSDCAEGPTRKREGQCPFAGIRSLSLARRAQKLSDAGPDEERGCQGRSSCLAGNGRTCRSRKSVGKPANGAIRASTSPVGAITSRCSERSAKTITAKRS